MARLETQIIAKYIVPVIGTYVIDEGMTVYLNEKKFALCDHIEAAKEKIRSSVAAEIKLKIDELQGDIALLNLVNVGLIDQDYRIKPFQ